MSATPKSSWGWVKAMLHSIYDHPDAKAVHAQFDRDIDTLDEKLKSTLHLARAVERAIWTPVTAATTVLAWRSRTARV